jgi:hypothetical protein
MFLHFDRDLVNMDYEEEEEEEQSRHYLESFTCTIFARLIFIY